MRPFEVTLLLLQAGTILPLLVKGKKTGVIIVLGVCQVLFLLFHWTLEGLRWQMSGAYLLVPVLVFAALLFRRPSPQRRVKLTASLVSMALLLASVAASIILPVPVLPVPGGPYQVGLRRLTLTDSSRAEPFTEDQSDHRELFLTVRYPARTSENDRPKPYWSESGPMSRAWVDGNGMSPLPFFWTHLGLARSHTYPEAEAVSGSFPVVVFSHGYWQAPVLNQLMMEALASQGYVVVGVTHPHEVPFALDEKGEVVAFSRENKAFQDRMEEGKGVELAEIMRALDTATVWNEQRPLFQEFYDLQPAWAESHQLWRDDVLFVIGRLPSIARAVRTGLDLSRIGVAGYSFGGSAAGEAAMTDDRVKAGVNLDAWQSGHLLDLSFRTPFLFFMSDGHESRNDFFFEQAAAPVFELMLEGSKHSNFTDMAYVAPLAGRLSGRLGTVHPRSGSDLVRRYVLAFFDAYLKGDQDFLSLVRPDPPGLSVKLRNTD